MTKPPGPVRAAVAAMALLWSLLLGVVLLWNALTPGALDTINTPTLLVFLTLVAAPPVLVPLAVADRRHRAMAASREPGEHTGHRNHGPIEPARLFHAGGVHAAHERSPAIRAAARPIAHPRHTRAAHPELAHDSVPLPPAPLRRAE